jgi:uncharacterized protein DUF5667
MMRISAIGQSIVAMLILPIIATTITSSAYAQETDALLPDPGILPDSPFYGLKRAFEIISTTLTFSNDAKALKSLELAQTRLAEARAMTNEDKSEFAETLLNQYTAEIKNANNVAASLTNDTKQAVSEKIAVATSRNIVVLQDMELGVPEKTKLAIASAKENSMKENMQALNELGVKDPEKATEIAKYVADAKVKVAFDANRKGDQIAVRKALDEKKEYEKLVDWIKTNAMQAEKDDSEDNHGKDNSKKSH